MENEEKTPEQERREDAIKKRDKKKLTLGNRLLLRVVLEHRRIYDAASGMHRDASLEIIVTQETMIDLLQDLVFFGNLVAEKVGSAREVQQYLFDHEEEDLKTLRQLREDIYTTQKREFARQVLTGSAIAQSAVCDTCGKPLCAGCGQCHDAADHGKTKPETQVN